MSSRAIKSPGKRAVLSVILSLLTLSAIKGIDYLPYSTGRDAVSDILAYPGALISAPFYSEGMHTGRGFPGWGYVAVVGNMVFYALLWFLVIGIVTKIMAHKD
jgi:hypothetical protein